VAEGLRNRTHGWKGRGFFSFEQTAGVNENKFRRDFANCNKHLVVN